MIDGRGWITERFGDERCGKVAAFVAQVVAENQQQNLIAPSTIDTIWERHVLDSAQLLAFNRPGMWIDIGTGGGFPGMVVALLRDDPVMLVEPRKKRAEFLERSAATLGATNVTVVPTKVQHITQSASIISARAVGSPQSLLQSAAHIAQKTTRWILPRGRSGHEELVALRMAWQGLFHVEQSLSDPEATILILDKVRPT